MGLRISLFLAVPATLLAGALAFACGSSKGGNVFQEAGTGSDATGGDASGDDAGGDADAGCGIVCDDAEAAPSCLNLQCKVDLQCSGQGKPQTTLTGTVYDPAGNLPLYNVYVYIPNAMPDPIKPGNPTCTNCEAPASGNPIIGTLTDAD